MINPTRGEIRNDSMGQGHFGAPRGKRTHNGTDYLCDPGQMILAPISGRVSGPVTAYRLDRRWKGVRITGGRCTVLLLYVKVLPLVVGQKVMAGCPIGKAQDISQKYGGGMKPHVHLRVEKCDPELLMKKEKKP